MRRVLSALLVSAVAGAALAGCGQPPDEPVRELAAALSPEGVALAAFGYDPADLSTDDPVAAADPEPPRGPRWQKWRDRRAARVILRRNVLHGEAVVRTADGTRTVLVQRGEVTAISAGTVTVTSTDGFAETWSYGDSLRVIESRTTVTPQDLEVGTPIGVAGTRVDGDPTARLIVVGHT